jgi:hypothetical protein
MPPTLTVRAQLTLRDPTQSISWKERLASEALYRVTEMEHAASLTLVEKYHMARNVAKTIQYELSKVCDVLERIQNVFLWVHPHKTALIVFGLAVALIIFTLVPVKYFVLYSVARKFTRRFHRLRETDVIRCLNFLSTFPTDVDEQTMFCWENQAYLQEKAHMAAQAQLQADWAGTIWKHGDTSVSFFASWASRYAAIRNGKLEYWNVRSIDGRGRDTDDDIEIQHEIRFESWATRGLYDAIIIIIIIIITIFIYISIFK